MTKDKLKQIITLNKIIESKLRQLENLQQAIVVNSKNHREKIIAVDSETFKIE